MVVVVLGIRIAFESNVLRLDMSCVRSYLNSDTISIVFERSARVQAVCIY